MSSNTRKNSFKRILLALSILAVVVIAAAVWQIDRMLPKLSGQLNLSGLNASVQVDYDERAIPTIHASNREDALRAMGFLTARERLFQMDLMRRKTAGRLSEIFGPKALQHDRYQRGLLMRQAAERAANDLPEDQRIDLQAYVDGINAFINNYPQELPPEFLMLGYKPEPWRLSDSMLVALEMFQALNLREEVERTLSIMKKTLPAPVTAFLTPDDDLWGHPMIGGREAVRPAQPVPARQLASLLGNRETRIAANDYVAFDPVTIGSNQWAVNGSRTVDGRAMIANDMHLKLRIPNIWYITHLRYAGRQMGGVSLPGLPLIAAGGNGHIAWGFTNALADLVDLVQIRTNPDNPDEYLTPDGYEAFQTIEEVIPVKGQHAVTLTIQKTRWGPVMAAPLLGNPVALNWTALNPGSVDLSLMDLDNAQTLEAGLDLMSNAGIPAMNAMLADDQGHIGWTLSGRYPDRVGFDGTLSLDWSNGKARWDGYLPAKALPRVIDPEEGFMSTANNRTMGADYPHYFGHNYASGYRAFRINQLLEAKNQITEADMLDIQLDTASEFYRFYQQQALESIPENTQDVFLIEARDALGSWDGRASRDSLGFGLLETFRKNLIRRTLAPYLAACAEADSGFTYRWLKVDLPVQELIQLKLPETLPEPEFVSWYGFLQQVLRDSASEISQHYAETPLDQLPWGQENSLELAHPFSQKLPLLSWLFDMPREPLSGCSYCVRVVSSRYGATERLVLSPNHPESGILHMPGGQSGNPLSMHYRDQQSAWVEGTPLPFLPAATASTLELLPAN